MYTVAATLLISSLVAVLTPSLASAEADDLRSYTVTVPAHVIGCMPFELINDDDEAAAKAIDAARQSWGAGALAAGVQNVGFLFVLDQDRTRKKGVYPITLSLCGTVEAPAASSPGPLSFLDVEKTKGQVIYCPSKSVEDCMQKIKDRIPVSADELPKFPRYAFWTRQVPPASADEAVDGLIGSLLPVTARIRGSASAQQFGSGGPELRPLGAFKVQSCKDTPDGCPTAEGPGDPAGVLVFLPD